MIEQKRREIQEKLKHTTAGPTSQSPMSIPLPAQQAPAAKPVAPSGSGPQSIIARRREFQKQMRLQRIAKSKSEEQPEKKRIKTEPTEDLPRMKSESTQQSIDVKPSVKVEEKSAQSSTSASSFLTDGSQPDWALANAIIKDIVERGPVAEIEAKQVYKSNARMWFLYQTDSWAYRIFKNKIANEQAKKAGTSAPTTPIPAALAGVPTQVYGRSDPELIKYAIKVWGHADLTEDQWKQAEDQIKLGAFFRKLQNKQKERAALAAAGKHKHEYDSDEEIDEEEGTWEHRKRKKEMEETKELAEKITAANRGKHHIGDFLPPDELKRFMEKFEALKQGRDFDDSDYAQFKLTAENLGYKMLQKLGWEEGEGLGPSGEGITAPINKGKVPLDGAGLGTDGKDNLTGEEDEFEAYRKRMMLAYRFRPNPLNNPRREYY